MASSSVLLPDPFSPTKNVMGVSNRRCRSCTKGRLNGYRVASPRRSGRTSTPRRNTLRDSVGLGFSQSQHGREMSAAKQITKENRPSWPYHALRGNDVEDTDCVRI